ncbi:MAG: hypothetical protein IPL59_00950 [Candidatus Competibacteraceae bacterium]|nr:hypothetical protein [Candidatus Competibacteraceae bacterium]
MSQQTMDCYGTDPRQPTGEPGPGQPASSRYFASVTLEHPPQSVATGPWRSPARAIADCCAGLPPAPCRTRRE